MQSPEPQDQRVFGSDDDPCRPEVRSPHRPAMYAGFAPTQAQIGSTAVPLAVFVVDLTRPKLLQLPWFYRLYHRVLQWLAWAHTLIDPVKAEVRTWIARQVRPF